MRIRVQGALIFCSGMILALFSKYFIVRWPNARADFTFDMLGTGMMLCGFLFRIIGRGYKESVLNLSRTLVTAGPYQLVRNPMYFGTLLIGIGISTIILNIWAGMIFLLVFLVIYVPQIKKEEALLRGRFGSAYDDYCRATPRFFFFPHRLFSIPGCMPFKPAWVRKESAAMLVACILVAAIELIQDARQFGARALVSEIFELSAGAFVILLILIIFLRIKRGHERNSDKVRP